MEISDIYPAFKTVDLWNREIEFRARQSLYTRKVTSHLIPGSNEQFEQPLGRVQFALALLDKVEEMYGIEQVTRAKDDLDIHDPNTSELDKFFGPKQRPKGRQKKG